MSLQGQGSSWCRNACLCAHTVLRSAVTGISSCRHKRAQSFFGEFKSSTLPQAAEAGPLSGGSFTPRTACHGKH